MKDTNSRRMSHTHTHQSELPGVILKQKEAYRLWLTLHRDFPKVERLGIGGKIERLLLTVLEYTFTAAYLPPTPKMAMLGQTILKLDVLSFFLQLAWESKLISTEKFADLSERHEEIGRMLGGWKKGLEAKLSP